MTPQPDPQPSDPVAWWRALSWVTPRLVVTGGLPVDPDLARPLLATWVEAGVTHVVDARRERSDEEFVARHAPHVRYRWAPTHDLGEQQPDEWFTSSTAWILDALAGDPSSVVLVHCHMGVNRGPSLAMAALMELGHPADEALAMVRAARPIAVVQYALQVSDWYHLRHDSPAEERWAARHAVETWQDDHWIDPRPILGAINRATRAEVA